MSLIKLGYIIAIRRIISAWHIEAILFIGIFLAVTLLSSSVVFSQLLSEVSLSHTLSNSKPDDKQLWLRSFSDLKSSQPKDSSSIYSQNTGFIKQRVIDKLRSFTSDHHLILETATFFFEGLPTLSEDDQVRPRGKVQYLSSLDTSDKFSLEAGTWPDTSDDTGSPMQVVVDQTGSKILEIGIGDTFTIFPSSQTQQLGSTTDVVVVGIFSRADPDSDYWNGREGDFSYVDQRWSIVPLFTTESNITVKLADSYDGLYTNTTWLVNMDPRKIHAGDVNQLIRTIHNIRSETATSLVHGTISVKLDRLLEAHEKELTVSRIPLLLMVFLVSGVLVYHLLLISNLTIKSRSSEIAILKSRGAGNWQLATLILIEGLVLSIPAIVLGVFLSPIIADVLGSLFFQASQTEKTSLTLLSSGIGILGALLAVSVLTLSTFIVSRKGIVEFRQTGSRPAQTPFIQRYYLDVLFLIVVGILWWQAHNKGSFIIQSQTSDTLSIDYSLLIAPIAGFISISLLVLRFFPVIVAIIAKLLEPVAPIWAVHGARKVSRDPIVPGSLVVLIMLATSLGVIGSSFSSTLLKSQSDQAMYQAGSDIRITHRSSPSIEASTSLDTFLTDDKNIDNVAYAHRVDGHLNTDGFVSTKISTLAIDPIAIDEIAWSRSDFVDSYHSDNLSNAVLPDKSIWESDGIDIPVDSEGLSVWVRPNRPYQLLTLTARLRDSSNNYFDLPIGQLYFKEWKNLSARFDSLDDITPTRRRAANNKFRGIPTFSDLKQPYTLLALHLTSSAGIEEAGAIFVSEMTAYAHTKQTLLTDFTNTDNIHVIEDHTRPGLYDISQNTSVVRDQEAHSLRFGWAPGGNGLRGIRFGDPEAPIKSIVSHEILEQSNSRVGDVITLGMSSYSVPIKINAVAKYFPTLDPKSNPFVIVDRNSFEYYSNTHSHRITPGPTEIWGSFTTSDVKTDQITDSLIQSKITLPNIHFAQQFIEQSSAKPVKNASWGGLLILMFLTLIIASVCGIIMFSYLDVIQRQGEFALIRTLGSSKHQVLFAVWFSLLIIFAFGIVLGTWVGQLIGSSILPLLEIAEDGKRITPPMLLQMNWISLSLTYLMLSAVILGTTMWLAWFTAKIDIQRVLRAGESAK